MFKLIKKLQYLSEEKKHMKNRYLMIASKPIRQIKQKVKDKFKHETMSSGKTLVLALRITQDTTDQGEAGK